MRAERRREGIVKEEGLKGDEKVVKEGGRKGDEEVVKEEGSEQKADT